MTKTFYLVPEKMHNELVKAVYLHRGYSEEEAEHGTRMCLAAVVHGIRTHNAVKALIYDEMYGQKLGACIPQAPIKVIPSRFKAAQAWDAGRKLGQSIAYSAMDTCMELADQYGVGVVSVDNCFHYVWGGAYVLYAAEKGYIAYTCCTAPIAEVVPYHGKFPTLGTNPHSWGFPTTKAIGYPVIIDWASSAIARGRVEFLHRENKELPPDSALDAEGNPTVDPAKAAFLLPFGKHKGYSMGLIDEVMAAFIGGSLPTVRGTYAKQKGEKYTTSFFFQVIHPDAISSGGFAHGRSQMENVKAVLNDILGHGNTKSQLPGLSLSHAKKLTDQYQALLFTKAEVGQLQEIARKSGIVPWDLAQFRHVEI